MTATSGTLPSLATFSLEVRCPPPRRKFGILPRFRVAEKGLCDLCGTVATCRCSRELVPVSVTLTPPPRPPSTLHTDILESRFYQPGDSPTWGKGPTKVVAAMRLQNLLNLDTRAGTYSIDFALILQWDDSRLFWRPDVYEGIKDIIFSRSAEDLIAVMGQTPAIWRPDIQFENAMNWHSHDLLGVMTRLHNTGMVTWSRHIVASFANTFDFTMFPFGTCVCVLTAHLALSWRESLVP